MEIGDKINWLITSKCNLNCGYCFAPRGSDLYQRNIPVIRDKLKGNNVSKVTISGGEPLTVNGVERVIKVLGESGKYVSLHTNGYFLTEGFARRIKPYVGDIAIPIDSMTHEINDSMRGPGSLETSVKAVEILNRAGIPVGVHTVATEENLAEIGKIRNYLKSQDFKYWKIYEEDGRPVANLPGEGDVHDFLGDFLIAEEELGERGNPKIQFVTNEDKMPYLFLNNKGDLRYSPWFMDEGKVFGNIFRKNIAKNR